MKDKVYFIAYSHMEHNTIGNGNCQVTTTIKDHSDVARIARQIEEHNNWKDGSVVIINWREF